MTTPGSPKGNALSGISSSTTLGSLNSDQISALQTALDKLGYGVDVDGILGPITSNAWARFKADNDLDQPDAIGPASIALLLKRSSGDTPQTIPPAALNIVKSFEGYSATAYNDATGVWTIGYGTTVYPDGSDVKSGDTITEDQAVADLMHDLQGTLTTLSSTIPYWNDMNDNQRSALISFGYNLGADFYGGADFPSISAALRDHRWSDVPSVLPLYSDPDDPSVHAGLLRRRIAEGDLWQGKGPYVASSTSGTAS